MAAKYVRLFVLSSFGWGVPWAILMYLVFGVARGASFATFLVLGVVGGLIFGACVTAAQCIGLRKYDRHDRLEAMKIRAVKRVVVCLDLFSAFQTCRAIFEQMGASVTSEDLGARSITGRTRSTWKSFGEIISVALEQIHPGETEVCVRSKPKLWTTLVDYGKNFQNVQQFSAFLTPPARPTDVSSSGSP